ncbi:hypothetical protein ACEPPN_000355 [Leptodophora sp. 'Broadleaf-Isolate-01']
MVHVRPSENPRPEPVAPPDPVVYYLSPEQNVIEFHNTTAVLNPKSKSAKSSDWRAIGFADSAYLSDALKYIRTAMDLLQKKKEGRKGAEDMESLGRHAVALSRLRDDAWAWVERGEQWHPTNDNVRAGLEELLRYWPDFRNHQQLPPYLEPSSDDEKKHHEKGHNEEHLDGE